MKKHLLKIILVVSLAILPLGAGAVNDVTLNGPVSWQILTADTAVLNTIVGQTGGVVTSLNVQSNYIDITLDAGSAITFNSSGTYFQITPQSGSGYSINPACVTTSVSLSSTANAVLRLELITTAPGCATGGGGTTISYPESLLVIINNGASTTASSNVMVKLQAENASHYMISNSPDFSGATWQAFTSPQTISWQLESGLGTKAVYVKFKSSMGVESSVISAAIEVVSPEEQPGLPGGFSPGDLIKGSLSAVYYYGADNKRHVFPNTGTYFSWYPDFEGVVDITDLQLSDLPLGSNVTYKPGVRMIKIQSDPKVYAVDSHGVLRWITTEEIAIQLYGANWADFVDDLNVAFWVNYSFGEPITDASQFNPRQVADQAIDINTDKQLF